MKKVVLFAIPAALLLTLTIAITAYAWTVDAWARCNRVGDIDDGYAQASAISYVSGIVDGDIDATARVGPAANRNNQWADNFDGSGTVMAFSLGNWSASADATANAKGTVIYNAGTDDEYEVDEFDAAGDGLVDLGGED